MPDVMYESSNHSSDCAIGIEFTTNPPEFEFAINEIAQFSRYVKYTDRMRKSAMRRSWKYEFGYAELLDSPETLKLRGLKQTPSKLINL